jgi:3-oxosteroid 1-dehydrogenase
MSELGWDETCDVLVVGTGGGLAGAYFAAASGLKTIVLESTDKFGGTTAYSGGGLWIPDSPVTRRAGVEGNTVEGARAYFHAVIGDRTPAALQDAYIDNAGPMIVALEKNPRFAFEHFPYPDYFHAAPGFLPAGRDTFPCPMPAEELGELLPLLRPPLATERAGLPMPELLIGGHSLIGQLLLAIKATGNAKLKLNTPMDSLIVENGRVVGVEAVHDGKRVRYRADRGVLLAAGGFERNAAMRRKFGVAGTVPWSSGAPGGNGRAIEAGVEIGAAVDLMDQGWWTPGLIDPEGNACFTTGVLGGVFVNGAGERFCNESMPYDLSGRAAIAAEAATGVSHSPFWVIYDARFEGNVPFNYCAAPINDPADYFAAGFWKKAESLPELAGLAGLPEEALVATVERFNSFAASGTDMDFHRGETAYDVFFSLEGDRPNKALVPIDKPPYFAAAFAVSDLGTKGGLKTDERARVLKADGSVIPGLYAAGNTMASVTGEVYPGPGCPVGTCMVFSYLAALDMAGTRSPSSS